VDDPLAQVRRLDPVRHVLAVTGTSGVVVAADAADAAGNEVRVARILALHEDRVAAEDRRGAMTLDHFAVLEVDLGVDAEAAYDPGDRIPGHLDELAGLALSVGRLGDDRCHRSLLPTFELRWCPLPGAVCTRCEFVALVPPARFLVERAVGDAAQIANHRAVQAGCRGGHLAARGFVHERHELVREPGHGAPDADSANVRAAADTIDPASLGHGAFDDWAPAAKLHNAFR